jgi:hypothetical protein
MPNIKDKSTADTVYSFRSRPGWRRPAYFPTVAILCAAWFIALTFIAIVATAFGLPHPEDAHMALAISLTMSTAFVVYLVVFTRRFIIENSSQYIFELGNEEARLKVTSTRPKHNLLVRMPYSEISFVEHFTPRDSAALVLHGKSGRLMEVPLWSMTENASTILNFLKLKNLPVETT